jgi:hypothetical protein
LHKIKREKGKERKGNEAKEKKASFLLFKANSIANR